MKKWLSCGASVLVAALLAGAACSDYAELVINGHGGSAPFGSGGSTSTSSSEDSSGVGINDDGGMKDACTADCGDAQPMTFCGDGVLSAGEQCDDGNQMPGDGCSGICE